MSKSSGTNIPNSLQEHWMPFTANKDFKAGFTVDMMLKDLRLSQEAAISCGANTPMGAEAASLFGLFEATGSGSLDFSSIIKLIRGQTA